MTARSRHVRFTPDSGHSSVQVSAPVLTGCGDNPLKWFYWLGGYEYMSTATNRVDSQPAALGRFPGLQLTICYTPSNRPLTSLPYTSLVSLCGRFRFVVGASGEAVMTWWLTRTRAMPPTRADPGTFSASDRQVYDRANIMLPRTFAASDRKAYGVDPKRPQRYNLRQARYDALAQDIDVLACKAAQAGGRLPVLDIGCGRGAASIHLHARPNFGAIDIDATDIGAKYNVDTTRYRSIFYGDLTKGYPELPDASYDVVICEQVLEHLLDLKIPMATIGRLVKRGGRAFIGVPIFLPPLHLARRYLVPIFDRLSGHKGKRTHVQAFTLANFKVALLAHCKMCFVEARGFRIISGGPLRPLEELRWWWAFNRWLGAKLPAACIEVQIVLEKPGFVYALPTRMA